MHADAPFPILTPELSKTIDAFSGDEGKQVTLLIGEAGVGKSFAMQTAAARTPRRRAAANACPHLAPMQLVELLLKDISETTSHELTLDALTNRLIAELVDDLGLVTINDAHLLPSRTLSWLNTLIGVPGIQVALTGQPWLVDQLPAELCQEASAIRFRPLLPSIVPGVIGRFHPVWVGSTPATIQLIDDRYAHGYFARWAEVTDYAIEICAFEEPAFVTGRIGYELLDLLESSDAAA